MCDEHTGQLSAFRKKREYFIGIDSDGCAFDTMEIKHKQCFIPNTIRHFGLQAVSRYAREAAEFVNLYSRWRGINRFPALAMTLDLLAERSETKARGVAVPRLPALRDWLAEESKPGNPALQTAIDSADGVSADELRHVLAWSQAVNDAIADRVRGVAPFAWVGDCLTKASAAADIVVVSATPTAALEREWIEHDIAGFAALIAGQELGTKTEHLQVTAAGKYAADRILMIGDAPGDLQAARAIGALFYPVNPGDEVASWQRLLHEALDKFFAGEYKGSYEATLIAGFERLLPDRPPWK